MYTEHARFIAAGSHHTSFTTAYNYRFTHQLWVHQPGHGYKKTIHVYVHYGSVVAAHDENSKKMG
jgi:hypothetical protein